MYAEDMMDEGDGSGGHPPFPRVSVENIAEDPKPTATVKAEEIKVDVNPYNHSALATDPNLQRQYHEYPAPSRPQPLVPQYASAAVAGTLPYNPSPPQAHRSRSRSRSRSTSRSPSRRARASSRSLSPAGKNHRRNSDSGYHLFQESTKRRSIHSDDGDQYEAQVALGIQIALFFFCILILVAVAMAIFSHHGYWVVIAVCLTVLVSLLVGLCCFLYQVVHEDDAPTINQKHMPRWYNTLTKMIKDELSGFREDWMDMVNNVYLLEDGDAGTVATGSMRPRQPTQDYSLEYAPPKPKKKKGKSALFKLVAKPAAVLASFRRKRKGKKKQKKAQQHPLMPMAEPSFPSTV